MTDCSSHGRHRRPRAGSNRIALAVAALMTVSLFSLGPALTGAADGRPYTARIDAGNLASEPAPGWSADTGYEGGRIKSHSDSLTIAGTDQDRLLQTARYWHESGGYRIEVPSAGTYQVNLHFSENIFKGPGMRVFDVLAEDAVVVDGIDVFAEVGRDTAYVRSVEVAVSDGSLDLEFMKAGSGYPHVSGIEVVPTSGDAARPTGSRSGEPTPSATQTTDPSPTSSPPTSPAPGTVPGPSLSPTPTDPTTSSRPPPPPTSGAFPTPESTGFRVAESALTPSGGITSSHDGQVIQGMDITGNVTIVHDNVTVVDSRISFTSTYGLLVDKKADGSCPVGARFLYVEVDGRLAAENDIPVYSPSCGWTVDHAYIHNVGRTSRMTNDSTLSNSYVFSNRTGDSGAHRGAVGTNGGRNNQIINNVLMCEGTGCSAAIPMYGDFAPVDGMLVVHNLLATTGSYCAYGGSLDSKPYPNGSNIRFIDNHFSTAYFSTCGRYGPISGFERGVRGNEFIGNVWHETGLPVP